MSNLNNNVMEFTNHRSIEEFKSEVKATTLQVVKNPKSGKLFVAAGGRTVAAVSTKLDKAKPMQVVDIVDGDTTVTCLCNVSTDNVQFEL